MADPAPASAGEWCMGCAAGATLPCSHCPNHRALATRSIVIGTTGAGGDGGRDRKPPGGQGRNATTQEKPKLQPVEQGPMPREPMTLVGPSPFNLEYLSHTHLVGGSGALEGHWVAVSPHVAFWQGAIHAARKALGDDVKSPRTPTRSHCDGHTRNESGSAGKERGRGQAPWGVTAAVLDTKQRGEPVRHMLAHPPASVLLCCQCVIGARYGACRSQQGATRRSNNLCPTRTVAAHADPVAWCAHSSVIR